MQVLGRPRLSAGRDPGDGRLPQAPSLDDVPHAVLELTIRYEAALRHNRQRGRNRDAPLLSASLWPASPRPCGPWYQNQSPSSHLGSGVVPHNLIEDFLELHPSLRAGPSRIGQHVAVVNMKSSFHPAATRGARGCARAWPPSRNQGNTGRAERCREKFPSRAQGVCRVALLAGRRVHMDAQCGGAGDTYNTNCTMSALALAPGLPGWRAAPAWENRVTVHLQHGRWSRWSPISSVSTRGSAWFRACSATGA